MTLKNTECLFEVGDRPIMKDSIHTISIEGNLIRMMLVGYAPKAKISSWIAPRNSSTAWRIDFDSTLLIDKIKDSGEHYLNYEGGRFERFAIHPDLLTIEQRRIYYNWDIEVEKARLGS